VSGMRRAAIRDYKRLFAAYVLGLLGTGIAVVALSLLAYDIAGTGAPAIIATALSIKSVAYILGAPVGAALSGHVPRRPLLIGLDLVRVAAILTLPLAQSLWQIYLAVLVFTVASALFTATYQAVVPTLIPDDLSYSFAISKSRIAGELEVTASPMIAAALLVVLSVRGLFVAAMAAFICSAVLIARTQLPSSERRRGEALRARLGRGARLLLGVPQLRFLIPVNFAVAAGIAMVMVNTVVLVQADYGSGPRTTAVMLGIMGLGTVSGALAMPATVARLGLRPTMLGACGLVIAALALGPFAGGLLGLSGIWFGIGLGAGLAVTPALMVIRRFTPPADQAQVYAAHFALTNASLLLGYAATGAISRILEPDSAFAILAALALAASLVAARVWRGEVAPRAPQTE
jgi:predicted MFS family arabinose efflux permease